MGLSVLVVVALGVFGQVLTESWSPTWLNPPRSDLNCYRDQDDSNCDQTINGYHSDKCCACHSSTTWEGQEVGMFTEYISVLGKTVVLTQGNVDATQVYEIEYTSEEMTEIPSNLCNWDKSDRIMTSFAQFYTDIQAYWEHIVKLKFEGNNIQQIVDLNCLTHLDSIDLQNNRITHLSNTSFHNLTHLRIINLANNLISVMDPIIVSSVGLGLFYVDISNNSMSTVDVTNILSQHPFCRIDYGNNQIEEITNELDFKLITDGSRTYGPGFVDLGNNIFHVFPDFQEILNLDKPEQVGKLIEFGFDLRGAKINCDCNVHPFMALATDVIETFWLDYMNISCNSPVEFKDQLIIDIPLEDLVCPIGVEGNCPKGCECVDRSEEDTLFVNCSYQGLTNLPDKLPERKYTKYINLDVSHNLITEITNVSYLGKVNVLDISHNKLREINDTIVNVLKGANVSRLDISNNHEFHTLPRRFQYLNECSVDTDHLIIDCNCETLWIIYWLRAKGCHNNRAMFKCLLPDHQLIFGPDFREDQVDCKTEESPAFIILTVVLGTVALVLIVVSSIFYYLRYEIMILILRFRQIKNSVVPLRSFDAFLSFDDDNEDLFRWVCRTLIPYLERAGYKLFLPHRDLGYGNVRDTETINVINNSQNFLLILSDSYFDQDGHCWVDNEWKYGWNMFKSDKSKNLAVVNFDHISSFSVDHPQIRAFLRVGGQVDFYNRDSRIFEDVSRKLGPPRKDKIPGRVEPVMNIKYTSSFELEPIADHQNIDDTMHNNKGERRRVNELSTITESVRCYESDQLQRTLNDTSVELNETGEKFKKGNRNLKPLVFSKYELSNYKALKLKRQMLQNVLTNNHLMDTNTNSNALKDPTSHQQRCEACRILAQRNTFL